MKAKAPLKISRFYPWFLAGVSFMGLFRRGTIAIRWDDLAITLLITLLLPLCGELLFRFLARFGKAVGEERKGRIRLATALFVYFFFAYKYVPEDARSAPYWFLFLALTLSTPLAALFLLPSRAALGLGQFALLWSVILFGGTSLQVLAQHLRGKAVLEFFPISAPDLANHATNAPASAGKALPDIYLFVLDGYGGKPALHDEYGEDNSAFAKAMSGLGFRTHPEMRTNYLRTELAMTAILNGDFVQNVFPKEILESKRAYTGKIQENWVNEFLRKKGYTLVHVGSGNWTSFSSPQADINLVQKPNRELLSVYMRRSMLDPLRSWLFFRGDVDRIRFTFDALEKIARDVPSPKFVFAHTLAPHPPYVLNPKGATAPVFQFRSKTDLLGQVWADKQGYRDQLQVLNPMIVGTIEDIYKRSATQPVVIALGDHGPASHFFREVDHEEVSARGLRERASVLFAENASAKCGQEFSKMKSTVNTFQVLFHCLFNEKPRFREDKVFHSLKTAPNHLWDVTETLERGN